MTQAEKLLFLLDHKRMTDKQKLETISEALEDICREQREACAKEIIEEEKDDQLIYSQTEAIRSLVKQTPLVTTKTDSDE